MAKLDSLIVDLQVNTAALRKGLDEANAKLEQFGSKVDKIGKVVSLTAVGSMAKQAVAGLVEFVMHGAQAADQMGKLAQSAGVPVEALSKLNYAAGLSGVSTEELGGALSKLNQKMAGAAAGSADQVALFKALGVSVKDAAGSVRSTDSVLGDIAERFAGMKDGASKAALAVEIFGKSGAQLIPFLNEGRSGIAALADEADRLGITISSATAAASERFNDNLEKLQLASQGVAQRVAGELAPALSELTDRLLSSREGAEALRDAAVGVAGVMKVVASAVVVVLAPLEVMGKALARIASIAVDVAQGNLSQLATANMDFMLDMVNSSATAAGRLKAIWSGPDAPEIGPVFDRAALSSSKAADDIVANIERMKKAAAEYEAAMKALEKVATDYEAKVAGFGAGPIAEMEAKLAKGELAGQLAKIGDKADEMRDRILGAVAALHELEMGKTSAKLDFEIGRTATKTANSIADRRTAISNVGVGADETAYRATAGFASFDAALSTLARQTDLNARKLAEAQLLMADGDIEGAQRALLFADAAERAAERAGKAADGFQHLKESGADLERQQKNMKKAFDSLIGSAIFKAAGGKTQDQLNAASSLGSNLAGKTGEAGKVVNSALQGFELGGIWGAVIGAIAELLSTSKQFTTLIERFDEDLQMLADALGEVLDSVSESAVAFRPLIEAIGKLLSAVIGVINLIHGVGNIGAIFGPIIEVITKVIDVVSGIFKSLGDMLGSLNLFGGLIDIVSTIFGFIGKILDTVLAPILRLLGGIFQAIGNILKPIINIIGAVVEVLKVVFDVLTPIIDLITSISEAFSGFGVVGELLGYVIKTITVALNFIALTILGTIQGIESAWGWILGVVHGFLKAVGADTSGIEALYKANKDNITTIQNKMVKIWANIDGSIPDLPKVAEPEFKFTAQHVHKLGSASEKAAASISKMTEQFTNVPAGFKLRMRAFESAGAVDSAFGTISGPKSGDVYTFNVQGNLTTINALAELVAEQQAKKRFRRSGAPVPP